MRTSFVGTVRTLIAASSMAAGLLAAASTASASQGPAAAGSAKPTHTFGVGGRAGGFTFGVGGSARYWSHERLGFQIDVSRYGIGVSDLGVRVSSSTLQLAPAVLYSFETESNSDAPVTYRPYVGGGVSILRSSLSSSASGFGAGVDFSESTSNTDIGFHGFGGVELTFKRVPKLGVSGEFGYYSTGEPFSGVHVGGFGASAAAHWFFK